MKKYCKLYNTNIKKLKMSKKGERFQLKSRKKVIIISYIFNLRYYSHFLILKNCYLNNLKTYFQKLNSNDI